VTTPALPIGVELEARLEGQPLVLLLDIDGTLSPIAPRPERATVPVATRAVLTDLATTPGVYVVFVTGRGAADGRRLVCVDEGWVIGNHGFEIARPREAARPRADVAPYATTIADAASRFRAAAAAPDWANVLVVDKRFTLSVH
jgi:trehalose-phosphatase